MELMDDFSIRDARLRQALEELRGVNRWLGGTSATMAILGPWLRAQAHRPVRLLDLATGIADFPEYLVRWADSEGLDVSVVAVDFNPATVAFAKETLDERLSARLRERITVVTGDALSLDAAPETFDAATTALFMHHLPDEKAVALLQEMSRLTRSGFVVNDLHRHILAYYGIRLIATVLPVSEMVRHDGPISVLRGFTYSELMAIALSAGIPEAKVRWHWAFRWTLSTL